MQRLTSKKTYFIVFLTTLFFLSISFYSNKDFYKQYIINKIYLAIDFQVLFQDSSISLFPAPGIILENVSIHNLDAEKKINAEIEKIHFLFSWKILFGEVELNSIEINGGKIELVEEEKKTKDSINSKGYDVKSIQKIFTFLNLDSISFHSTQFIYKKKLTHLDDFFVNSLTIGTDHISLISLSIDINYQTGNFKSETKIKYTNNNHSFDSLEIESKWKCKNISLKPLKEYYKLIAGANFDNTTLNAEFTISKEKFKNQYNIKIDTSISNLFFSGDPVYPTISANSEFTYTHDSKKINFKNIYVFYENAAITNATGSLNFINDITLNLSIQGEYADIYKVIHLIARFSDFNVASNINFYSHVTIFCKKATFDLYEFSKINLELNIVNNLIGVKINNANVLNGAISGKGKVTASNNSQYSFDVIIKEINSEELIKKYTTNPYIKGNLSANLIFSSEGNSFNIFLEKLMSTGKVEIKNGELLGYANILKPIFSLGKLINFLGPRGRNTEFQSLNLDYSIQNEMIRVQNLKMIGVGIDAHGGGNISFERKIDFRIYAGLGGIAGKALYIPILYKGIMPDNVSYIDPVWIGSVYVGATLLSGPAGATVGGFAGSAVSEYVNKAWEGIKGIFSREPKAE